MRFLAASEVIHVDPDYSVNRKLSRVSHLVHPSVTSLTINQHLYLPLSFSLSLSWALAELPVQLKVWFRYLSLNSFSEAVLWVAAFQSGLRLLSLHTARSVRTEMRERLRVEKLAAEWALFRLWNYICDLKHCFLSCSEVYPQLLRNIRPAPAWLIFNVADLGVSFSTAFNHSGHFELTFIAAFLQIFPRFCVQLIKQLSSVVYNCLIRVLLIIVIKKSSIHIRKRKKHLSPLVY